MLILVFVVAFMLRFFLLSSLPPGLDWDEASTAYNAYSILKTGKDEFGESFPFLFRAYDGYTPPLLTYLNIPAVAIFGLNEFGARFTNAVLGTFSIFGICLLAKELFKSKKLAGTAALFLAISPWHVTYSRVNFFATLPIFFTVFATYFFLKGKARFLFASAVFFVLAILAYFSAYIFVPLFAVILAALYIKKLKLRRAVLFLTPIILAAVFILFLAGGGQARYRGVSAFGDPDLIKQSTQFSVNEGALGQVIHNRRIVYAQKFLEGYFANFRFDFLFGKSDQVVRMVVPGSGFGLLYFWDLPFLALGIYFLAARKPSNWKMPLAWLAIAPIAAAPTLPVMTSTRASLMIPALVIISAYGFYFFMKAKGGIVKGL
ncbi:glycosyltransferase family 39 protein, partial [Candidatus Curtissbacteria bacterium]|nr:glycosyltransferase family 39 protein [Candidatus Curtissbacteria bacterium]